MLWVCLSLSAGIGLADSLSVGNSTLMVAMTALSVLALLCYQQRKEILLLCVLALWFSFEGAAFKKIRDSDFPARHLKLLLIQQQLDLSLPCRMSGEVVRDPIETPYGFLLRIRVHRLENAKHTYETQGDVRLSLPTREGQKEMQKSPLKPGQAVEVMAMLHEPRNFRNPGAFDYAAQLQREGIFLVGTLKSISLVQNLGGSNLPFIQRAIEGLRHRLLERIRTDYLTHADRRTTGSILEAMLLGNRQLLGRELEQDFQATGIFHILVIAGLHVGVVAYFLLRLLRLICCPKLIAMGLTIGLLACYAWMVEARIPVVRAVVMASVLLIALGMERGRSTLNAIGIAALMILWWQPGQLFDPGFIMSFASVLSIAVLGMPLVERWFLPRLRALEGLEDIHHDPRLQPSQASLRVHLRYCVEIIRTYPMGRLLPTKLTRIILVQGMKLINRIGSLLVISGAIQISFTLLMATYFNRISYSSLLMNLVAVPMVGLLVPCGIIQLGLSFISPTCADILAAAINFAMRHLVTLNHWMASIGQLNFRVPVPPGGIEFGYVLALVGLGVSLCRWNRRWIFFCSGALLVLIALVAACPFPPRENTAGLRITMLDVGQGDCLLVEFPDGRRLLIDGGGLPTMGFLESSREQKMDIGEDVVMRYLWWRRIKFLDGVVSTHAHSDHISGLMAVMRNCRVGELWIGSRTRSDLQQELLKEAEGHSVAVRVLRSGDFMTAGPAGIHVYSAGRESSVPLSPDDADSLVMGIAFGTTSAVLTGDARSERERELRLDDLKFQAVLLKLAHHGSKTSTSEDFLDRAHPLYALISVGASNPFGHPSPEILERLRKRQVKWFETRREGAVMAVSDGRKWIVSALSETPRHPAASFSE